MVPILFTTLSLGTDLLVFRIKRMSTDKFNVAILLESLRETIVKDDVLLDQYCKSFEELAKYFSSVLWQFSRNQTQTRVTANNQRV